MDLTPRHDVECERKKRVASENGSCIVESLMDSRPSATEVVIIHGRKVVVDQRITMHELKGGTSHQRAFVGHAKHRRCLDHQKRPQPFAAIERSVPHGRNKPWRAGDLAFE